MNTKPICTKDNPAKQLFDGDGHKLFNHEYIHPDCFVSHKWESLEFVQIFCPNCNIHYGYNQNVFLSKSIPPTFWKTGEYDNNQKIHDGDYKI